MPLKNSETNYSRLKNRIKDRSARVAVMGMGRIGLPLAVSIAGAGFQVVGVDTNKDLLKRVGRGVGGGDVDDKTLRKLLKSGRLTLSNGPTPLASSEIILICVPTPLHERRDIDLSYVESAVNTLARTLKKPALVILESTTYPGTTEEVIRTALETKGRKVGRDIFLAHGPERLDPGNPNFSIRNTTKLVGGVTARCGSLAAGFYKTFVEKVRKVSSPRVAETAKVFENIFRNVNIALVNEFVQICSRMDIDAYEVLEGAATKEFGFMSFKPGPGVGGHCIPLDPYYFLWKSHEFDVHPRFVQLSLEINENMPYYVVDRIRESMNRQKKSISGSRVLLLGMAYKAGISDIRESPALKIFELLERGGAKVAYHDEFCSYVSIRGKTFRSASLTPALLKKMDAVIITTGHPGMDYDMVLKHSRLIMDTRYILKGRRVPAEKVVWL